MNNKEASNIKSSSELSKCDKVEQKFSKHYTKSIYKMTPEIASLQLLNNYLSLEYSQNYKITVCNNSPFLHKSTIVTPHYHSSANQHDDYPE